MGKLSRKTAQPSEITRESVAGWEQKRPALKALNDATLDKPRGYAIQAAKCWELCGGKGEFCKVAAFWKRSILWLRGVTIEYDAAARSYTFPLVEQHLTRRHQRVMAASERKHRGEALRLGLIRDADMTSDHERRLRLFQMTQHNDTAGKIEAQREHFRIAVAQPETLPRLPG